MIWDFIQSRQLRKLSKEQSTQSSKQIAGSAAQTTTSTQLDYLKLVSQAMWELLSEKVGVSDVELMAKS